MAIKEGAVKMSEGCAPCREMTLPEEIKALKEYNVPEHVIDRILRQVNEKAEWERLREKNYERVIQDLKEKNRNKDAVINALGGYLARKSSMESFMGEM